MEVHDDLVYVGEVMGQVPAPVNRAVLQDGLSIVALENSP